MRSLDEKALSARDKKAKLGQDIDIEAYGSESVSHNYVKDLDALPEADKIRIGDTCPFHAGRPGSDPH
jgi:hypothetical protein